MLYLNLKQSARLNRYIGITFLFYAALSLFAMPAFPDIVRIGLTMILSLGFLLVNEAVLRTLKRFPKADPGFLDQIGFLMPVFIGAYVGTCYLLAGQLGFFLFLGFAPLEAQFFGHTRMAKAMTVGMLLFYLVTMPLGYPYLLGFSHSADSWACLMVLAPFLITLIQYGRITSALVRSTSDKVVKLQSLAATDALTGLINRRQFNHQLHAEIARARRYQQPLSLALFDIDDFKKINDFYGHPMGDRILKELGALIKDNVRESDIAARYGGEEFALILPETRQVEAYELLERLRAMIAHTVFCLPDNPMTISISVGIAQIDLQQGTSFELVEQADAALYEAKKQGKNQVIYGVVPVPKVSFSAFGASAQPENTEADLEENGLDGLLD